ncbi:hypothetical protein [Streptomyces sp. NPDC048521]|uniref:hypothetical protein n=1 Tax=Streptomyces sp. NPDC048521 TaxID=3365566 RepID=UPI003723AD93
MSEVVSTRIRQRITGAARGRWVNAGLVQDEYHDHVVAGRPAKQLTGWKPLARASAQTLTIKRITELRPEPFSKIPLIGDEAGFITGQMLGVNAMATSRAARPTAPSTAGGGGYRR